MLEPDDLIKAYESILLLRRFEEKCGQLYGMGLIGGFCHLYIGQEAVAVAMDNTRIKGDSFITSYRTHAHSIISGTDPKFVLAELMGKSIGCSKGKGGSMHMFNPSGGFYGGHGIVGAQVSIGTGLAFAHKYRKENNICYVFLGDGALHQGQVYESFNMAALWQLPVLYIIENNRYAMGTSVARATSSIDLYKRGQGFGIEGYRVDGMDFVESYTKFKHLSTKIRNGEGPQLLECMTYRYRGHSMSDPATYRQKLEVEEFKSLDPLVKLKEYILSLGHYNENDLKEIAKSVKATIQQTVDYAQNSEQPSEEELFNDVYIK